MLGAVTVWILVKGLVAHYAHLLPDSVVSQINVIWSCCWDAPVIGLKGQTIGSSRFLIEARERIFQFPKF